MRTQREQWLAERRTGIGGSDAPRILGLVPDHGPIEVYLEKTGDIPTATDDVPEELEWGLLLESAVLKRLSDRHPEWELSSGGMIRHRDIPWWLGTPDGVCIDPSTGDIVAVAEAKTTGLQGRSEYGAQMTDEVPERHIVQCQHYMTALRSYFPRVDRAHLAVLIAGQRWRQYIIPHSPKLENAMRDVLGDFWNKHILTGTPPELDASEAARRFLEGCYPASTDLIRPSTAVEDQLMERIKSLEEAKATILDEYGTACNRLKALIGEDGGISGPLGRVTWKKAKDALGTDWQAVAEHLRKALNMDPEELTQLTRKYEVVTRKGSRRFNTNWTKEEQ